MKKEYVVSHCGLKNGKRLTLKMGEKIGFICEGCQELYEVDYDGNITRSPLNDVRGVSVCKLVGGNVCTGFGGKVGEVKRW